MPGHELLERELGERSAACRHHLRLAESAADADAAQSDQRRTVSTRTRRHRLSTGQLITVLGRSGVPIRRCTATGLGQLLFGARWQPEERPGEPRPRTAILADGRRGPGHHGSRRRARPRAAEVRAGSKAIPGGRRVAVVVDDDPAARPPAPQRRTRRRAPRSAGPTAVGPAEAAAGSSPPASAARPPHRDDRSSGPRGSPASGRSVPAAPPSGSAAFAIRVALRSSRTSIPAPDSGPDSASSARRKILATPALVACQALVAIAATIVVAAVIASATSGSGIKYPMSTMSWHASPR